MTLKDIGFVNPIIEHIIDPPSPSELGIGLGVNMIAAIDFKISWPRLKEDYCSSTNSSKRLWFQQMDNSFYDELKTPWIADMERLFVDIPFFT